VQSVPGLSGVRVLVVGASSGVGRAVAALAIQSGAKVVVAARRAHALDSLVADAGSGLSVPTDITDPEQCGVLAARCVDELGQLDLVINATGVTVLRPIAEMGTEDWWTVFGTNVIGASNLISAIIGGLSESAIVATISSVAAHQRPRTGLGGYAASKTALDMMLGAWRNEHAPIRFACVEIGDTAPTEVADGFDPDLLATLLEDWSVTGALHVGWMTTDDLAFALLGILAAGLPVPGVNLEHITLRTPTAVRGSRAATKSD
jgi:NAD(P)-dependent dehydrogenase (short-subunit alcohol dehydrogenase family)